MQAQVAVAELEPGLTGERSHGLERIPALPGATPAPFLVGEAAERVEHAVEIRRNAEAEDLDVVANVAHDGYVVRFEYRYDAAKEARPSDATREDGRLHAAFPVGSPARRSEASTLLVRGPSRSCTRSRSATASTSSMRFGASTSRDGPSAANRSALPGP